MLVRGSGAVDSEVRTSHCCRKYSHSSAGAPAEMRMSRGPSSAVKWQKPGSRNLEGERNWEHEVEWVKALHLHPSQGKQPHGTDTAGSVHIENI